MIDYHCPRCQFDCSSVQERLYTCPLAIRCPECDWTFKDPADPEIHVLTKEEAMRKRPELYGLPKKK